MDSQIAIYSTDAVFARMIELEFLMLGRSVYRAEQTGERDIFAEIVILDLDSAAPPPADSYRRMIGFTQSSALLNDDARRSCSMILHRPFEMRLLRREVLSGIDGTLRQSVSESPATSRRETVRLRLEEEKALLHLNATPIHLSRKEADVMGLLLANRGETVSKVSILDVIGESDANKAEVYICFLRRKLEAACGTRVIATVRGKGYKLL